jgi:hypothetical protein
MLRTNGCGWLLVVALAVNSVVPWWSAPAEADELVFPPRAGAFVSPRAQEDDPFAETPARPGAAAPSDDPFGDGPATPVVSAPATPFAIVPVTVQSTIVRTPTAAVTAEIDTLREAKIREALDSATTMDFVEIPLQDAVDYIKDLHGIEIQLDGRALEEAGLGSDTPITRTLMGVSLGSALRRILSAYDMSYIVHDGVLLISTPAALSQMIELRVYDIHDLLGPNTDADDLAETLSMVEARISPYRNLLVVRASVVQHELMTDLLAAIRTKLDTQAD